MKQVKKLNLDIKIIVATHSHPDHLMALGDVKKATGASFAMHGDEPSGKRAAGASRMISLMVGSPVEPPPDPDISLKDGDIIEVGDLKFTVLHTPGHSPGGICLYGNGQRVLVFDFAADQFVGLGDTDGFGYARQNLEFRRLERALIAGDADGRSLRPRHRVGAITHRFDLPADAPDVLFRRLRLHDDQHGSCLLSACGV